MALVADGDCATEFKARTPISDASFEFTQKIAEGSTADVRPSLPLPFPFLLLCH